MNFDSQLIPVPIQPDVPLSGQVSFAAPGFGIKEGLSIGKEPSFKEIVGNFLSTVNQLQIDADAKVRGLATGEVKNLHEVMIASEKAGLAMQFTMQLRNRLIEAYQDILRTQV